MLTFFRRIRKGLLGEGATSKYLLYAIGEMALVVIGILIALQINNWNENRIDRLDEKQILHHLHEEFQLNKIKLNEVREIMGKNQSACRKILALIGSSKDQLVSNNLDSLIYYSTMYVGYNPTQNVLSDLLHSGRLQLITDEAIRNLLFEWSQVLLEMQEWYTIGDGWFQEQILPYLSKHTSLRAISAYEVGATDSPSKLIVDSSVIFSDLQYENFMQNLLFVLQVYEENLEKIDQIIEAILRISEVG
jgi:hypothetical protein